MCMCKVCALQVHMHLHIDRTLLHALAGAHPPDLVIFLGLAVYAVAGCKAQDLRVESSNQVARS